MYCCCQYCHYDQHYFLILRISPSLPRRDKILQNVRKILNPNPEEKTFVEPQIPQKIYKFGGQKSEYGGKKISISRIHLDIGFLQKERIQIGHFWPLRLHLQSRPGCDEYKF